MDQQLQEQFNIDQAQHVAKMEGGIGMTEWINVKVNPAFKITVRIVASILHTSASQIAREAIFAWMDDHYPHFSRIYHEQLTKYYANKGSRD